jgi:hypothetical protein
LPDAAEDEENEEKLGDEILERMKGENAPLIQEAAGAELEK